MNITMICIGTRGDVQPYIALGMGLQASGHTVRVATHRLFADLTRDHGLEFVPVVGDPRSLAIEWAAQTRRVEKGSGFSFMRELIKWSMPHFEEMVADCADACRAADAIIVSPVAVIAGSLIGEKMGIPVVRGFFVPKVPTTDFPAFPVPRFLRTRSVNRWSHQALRQISWMMIRNPTNRVRTSMLALSPLPWKEQVSELERQRQLMLVGCSTELMPRPTDWGDWIRFTGFWFLDRPSDWRPPADLEEFINAGSPPVYVGFGSMPSHEPEQTTEVIVDALRQAGQRGVLSTGWNGLSCVTNSSNIYVVDDVPHSWLFPRMSAVVHHGGIGTTAEGLRAGVPTVVVPLMADQPFWGRRVCELGVGPCPIPRKELTADRLAEAIHQAMSDAGMRQRAAALGERIRQEDGVTRAVEAFNQYFASERPAMLRSLVSVH